MNFKNKNLFIILALLGGLLLGGFLGHFAKGKKEISILPKEKAVQKALAYINNNLLEGEEKAVLQEISEQNGLYKFKIKIGSQEFEPFVTQDGKLLFLQAIALGKESEKFDLERRERPDVKLFVMSYCPFGLQAEKALLPVYKLLKEKADIGIYFVDYAMHGKKEIDENLRQYCLQKLNKDKYFDYLSCFVKTDNSEECLEKAKIDKAKLFSCIKMADKEFQISKAYNDRKTWLGGRFPKFPIHQDLNEKYEVQGSPTLVINDQKVHAQRSPEGFKKVICKAFKNPPQECSQSLSDKITSPGFGESKGNVQSGGACQ